MQLDDLEPDLLWRYYQKGYYCLLRSGLYFRSVLRPALSHVYFQRALPLLAEYARANRGDGDLSPGFGTQMEACPLTPRDLLHLDYAICLGYAEVHGADVRAQSTMPVLDWPGPGGAHGVFIAADISGNLEAVDFVEPDEEIDFDEDGEAESEDEDNGGNPPFDL